ncbi:hypothetical protein EDB84DRAFT_1452313 [Lactarius hengduanensis]|nr:hypothetical protein EDB84DRAFT_1452313 [Lactarius hengduanensis]
MRPFARYHIRATLLSARRPSNNVSTSPSLGHGNHSAESYFKEVDSSPPADDSTYQVDGSSDKVQRPHEPPSGKFSQAGVGSEEYRTVDRQEPYELPSNGEGSEKLRYGGKERLGVERDQPGSEENKQ